MKSLARGYVWWPSLNSDIEDLVKRCEPCQLSRPQPTAAPIHPWEWPAQPWTRIHLDFAVPWMNHMFLVLVDATSKWLDICIMSFITSSVTIEKLQSIFSVHGLPKVIFTDNGRSFVSDKFESFCSSNGIKHLTSSPYHPATNGLAERGVQTFKHGVKRMANGNLQSKLSRFLFRYRITPHSTTGISPAEMLMGRRVRSQLDLAFPDVAARVEKKQNTMMSRDSSKIVRTFKVGENVYVRDYRPNADKGVIVKVSGPLSYHFEVASGTVRRHVDGLRKRHVISGADAEPGDFVDDPLDDQDVVDVPLDTPIDTAVPATPPNPPTVPAGPVSPVATSTAVPANPNAAPAAIRQSSRGRPPPSFYHDMVCELGGRKCYMHILYFND